MFIKWFCKNFCSCVDTDNILPPNYLDDINYSEITTIINAEFPNATLLLSDNDYKTTTKEELIRFLKEDITDDWTYVSEYMDCDDFSYSIMGQLSNPEWGALPFGILWTSTPNGGHAVNCFIDNDREVWILEPQTDVLFKLPTNWDPYVIMM